MSQHKSEPKQTESQSCSQSADDDKQRVGGIVLDAQNNLLVVFGNVSQKWSVPKGYLEDGESYLDGALREIREETGLKLQPETTKRLYYWGINNARLYLLQVDRIRPKIKPRDKSEISHATWLNLNNDEEVEEISACANKMLVSIIYKLKKTQLNLN